MILRRTEIATYTVLGLPEEESEAIRHFLAEARKDGAHAIELELSENAGLRYRFRTASDLGVPHRIFKATAIGSLLLVAVAFMYRGGVAYRTFSYSRAIFAVDFLLALASMGALRMLLRSAQIFARRRGINLIPTLIVGRGHEAALCIQEMRARPELGYRVIGIVENEFPDGGAATFEGVPVISDLRGLPDAIRESGANEVIISDPNVPGEALFDVMIQTGRRRGVEFRIAPTLLNCLPSKTEIDQVGSLPMVTLFRSPLSGAARIATPYQSVRKLSRRRFDCSIRLSGAGSRPAPRGASPAQALRTLSQWPATSRRRAFSDPRISASSLSCSRPPICSRLSSAPA